MTSATTATVTAPRRSQLTADLAAAAARMRELTLTDPLTGLRNRRYLEQRVAAEIARRQRRSPAAAPAPPSAGVLVVDLDGLDRINRALGYPVGDHVLQHLAATLVSEVHVVDMVLRWGGGEFLVLLPDADPQKTAAMADRLLRAVRERPFPLAGPATLALTCSIGWAGFEWPEEAAQHGAWKQATALAESALAMAKQAGRDKACGVVAGTKPETEASTAEPASVSA